MLQRLWQLRLSWDESVPTETYYAWKRWSSQAQYITDIKVPRHIFGIETTLIELHGFCDAEAAYGACVYVRSLNSNEEYEVHLLCAKSRVAPLKEISLPRLELCGALLLAKLCNNLKEALTVPIQDIFYWSDSTITLAWISGEPCQWKTFVANRTFEIQRITDASKWNHVRSKENPADVLSKGISPKELLTQELWWNGPAFLRSKLSLQVPIHPNFEEIPETKRFSKDITLLSVKTHNMEFLQRYSSLTRLKRVVAYCLRFITNLRSKRSTSKAIYRGPLTVQELENSLLTLIKLVQTSEFQEEIYSLHRQSKVSNRSKLKDLHPFIDSCGLIRVGGLRNAPIDYSHKNPLVLPRNHHITNLIIRDEHYRNQHAGHQAVLAAIRLRYWPISGKGAVCKVLRSCIVCFRSRPRNSSQLMGHLPTLRVTQARPFLNSGVDYAGPFNIKISRNKSAKAYLCIFVCFSTKAVHLELVSDLSTHCFLNALKRFVARRGKCVNIYSDNGTNFVDANNTLQELKQFLTKETTQKEIQSYLSEQFITWHFIPAYSPHMGGLWEAAVKSAKTHMRKIIGPTLLSFEELSTIFAQIEACPNSRPLIPLSNDPTDLCALTPGHFIIGEVLMAIPEQELTDVTINRLNRYELLVNLKQHFWKRWSQEYLSQLQSRSKWTHDRDFKLQSGTMVILKNENTPSMIWPLARVIETHPDAEGKVRIVTLRTKNSLCQRSLPKICVLPIE